MAYIGRGLDKVSNVEVLDNLTFDGSSTSFTLQKSSVNFTPSSANNILVSIDGVVQAGNFTCSGSTIDFGVAPAASSTCDFILHYGVGVVTTPSDNSVTHAKLSTTSINSQTAETSIAGDDEVLIYDTSASALRKMTRTNFVSGVGGVNTPAFEAYLSSDSSQLSNDTDTKIQFNTEIFDTAGAYDNSTNYRFTVPSGQAGKYFIYGRVSIEDTNVGATDEHMVKIFKNGSQASVFFNYPNTNRSIMFYGEVFDLSASDYIEIYAKINNSDGARKVSGNPGTQKYTTFGAFKIIE